MNIRQNKIVYEILMDEFDAHRTKVSPMGTEAQRDTSYWAFVMHQKKILEMDQNELARYIIQKGWEKYYPRTMELLKGYGYVYTIEIQ